MQIQKEKAMLLTRNKLKCMINQNLKIKQELKLKFQA